MVRLRRFAYCHFAYVVGKMATMTATTPAATMTTMTMMATTAMTIQVDHKMIQTVSNIYRGRKKKIFQ